MNTHRDLERRITGVFANEAPSGYPEELLGRVLTTTSRIRPRPTWLADIKEPPMRTPSRVVVGSPALRLAATLALTLALALATAGALAAGASLLPGPPLPDPYGPARNGSLVYGEGGTIFVADADGANPRPIITSETDARYPSFSQDGTRILFGRGPEADLEAMVAKADGTDVRHAFPDAQSADFLPGQPRLVGTRTVTDRMVLSIIDLDEGTISNLDIGDIEPRGWVVARPPDGDEVIFTGRPHPGLKDLGIFAIRPDGSGLRTIGEISTSESGDNSGGSLISFQDPTVSPDGQLIGYWNWEPDPARDGASDAKAHLRDLTSGQEVPLQFDPTDGSLLLHFSPDGTKVVFEGSTDDGVTQHLFVAPLDGSGPTVPIGDDYSYGSRMALDFSPDGAEVFLALVGGTQLIDVASGEGTELTSITSTPGWQRLAPLAP